MNRILCVIILIVSGYNLALGEGLKWDHSVDSVTNLIMRQDYESAYKYCHNRLAENPFDIDAQYLRLITLQSQIADYESYVLDGLRCITMAESTLISIDKLTAEVPPGGQTLKLNYYRGSVLGILGILKAKRGSLMSGVKDAWKSYEILKTINDSVPTTEALYGIGLFDYYIGDNLKWLPGVGKRALNGLDLLSKVSNSDSPFRYGAKNSLLWILLERGEYALVDSICSEVLREYPESSVFLQIKGRAALGARNYEKAINSGKELIDVSLKRETINWTDVMSGYQLICACWKKLGKREKARETAKEGLSYKISSDTLRIEWVQKHRDYLMSIR